MISGSARPPDTSLTMLAPAAIARSATSARMVSTLTVALEASSVMTGTTRSSSSCSVGRVAPGRVDSPPMSRMSAPSASSSSPWAIAASGSTYLPPSENESGVTLTTPMSSGPRAACCSVVMAETLGGGCPRSAPVDEGHRLGAGGLAEHLAADGGGDGAGPGLLHPAHGHAQVLGLDHDDDAAGLEDGDHRVGDLTGEALLDLGPLRVDVDEPGQLGQPGDLAGLGRDVAHVGDPGERHQVVLAHGPQLDVAHEHHLVVTEVEGGREDVLRRHPQTRGDLGVRPGHPGRGVAQALALGVLPDGDQQLTYGGLGPLLVEVRDLAALQADRVD